MTEIVALDGDWRSANPLPTIESGSDKNSRGRVLLVGGARFVPGALALTGEAVLRAGAGKLQMATVEAVASALGVLVPEAAMVGLPMREDGEIAQEGVAVLTDLVPQCDVLLVGPGMSATSETDLFVQGLLSLSPPALLLDAAAFTCADAGELATSAAKVPLVLTPHHGEMARLIGCDRQAISNNPAAMLADLVQRTGAFVALKGGDPDIAFYRWLSRTRHWRLGRCPCRHHRRPDCPGDIPLCGHSLGRGVTRSRSPTCGERDWCNWLSRSRIIAANSPHARDPLRLWTRQKAVSFIKLLSTSRSKYLVAITVFFASTRTCRVIQPHQYNPCRVLRKVM